MKSIALTLLFILLLTGPPHMFSQENTDYKVVLITLDGLRWQELFYGVDSALVANEEYVRDTSGLKSKFWRKDSGERRKILMPFLWTEAIKIGQIHGNRNLGSKVNLTNTHWFSYPGYNEILSGKADDDRIDSNDKINNPNITVLERVNNSEGHKGKVAAFGSWDVFPFIINKERSGILVNAGFEIAQGAELSLREQFLNEFQPIVPSPWSTVRLDAFTHHYALEYMKREKPDFIYIAYGETDDFAHEGNYQAYVEAANNTDGLIEELWEFTTRDEYYRDKTIFIITTDHGRGTKPLDTWQHHGNKVDNADQVWLICFGKNVVPSGEIASNKQLFSNQIAPGILSIFGLDTDIKARPLEILQK